jgi:hypothetical protein
MNRKDKQITDQSVLTDILKRGKHTTIAICRGDEPYIVTLNYGYDQNKNALYFHCSTKGLKLDFINQNPHVCATVIEDGGYKMGECDQAYRSVVLWGKMHVVENLEEKKHAITIMLNHLEEDPISIREHSLKGDEAYEGIKILRLDILGITGKQGE